MNRIPAEKQKSYAGSALRTFFNICDAWRLDNTEKQILLGLTKESIIYKWKNNPNYVFLSTDTLERLSYIFGIYKALQILLPDPNIADNWVHCPNSHPLFNGKKPIERMLSEKVIDLCEVRRYLDAE